MAFDMGFDFRGSSGYVTDPAYGVPVLGEAFPHTYTNGNGQSINAGWLSPPAFALDRVATNDPRIAGANYADSSGAITFQIDLSSGSAPGAGTYVVDEAMGEGNGNTVQENILIKDNTTTLIDLSNGGAGFDVASGHFIDATATDVAASTTWTGATVTATWTTTTVNVVCGTHLSNFTKLAHFRLTSAASGATRSMLLLLGVGA